MQECFIYFIYYCRNMQKNSPFSNYDENYDKNSKILKGKKYAIAYRNPRSNY